MSAGIKANNDGSGAIQIGGSDYIQIGSTGNVTIPQNLAVTGTTTFTGATTAASIQVGGVATNLYPLVSGTAVTTTSGTSADFTGIPSTAKRITVMLAGVSLTTTASDLLIRIGSGSFEATGYVGGIGITNSASTANAAANTTGIYIVGFSNAADTANGAITITNVSGNLWVASGAIFRDGTTDAQYTTGCAKTTSGVLDRVQVVLSSTGAFDAGTINIMWE